MTAWLKLTGTKEANALKRDVAGSEQTEVVHSQQFSKEYQATETQILVVIHSGNKTK